MAQNLLGKIFNKQPVIQESPLEVENSAPKNPDGLTGVARYLKHQQAPEAAATAQEPSNNQAAQQASNTKPTGVAKYVDNIKPIALTGVAKYLVKQIVPEYQTRAAEAAKAAAPTGVAKYLAKVTAASIDKQPAIPSSVENYLKKLG